MRRLVQLTGLLFSIGVATLTGCITPDTNIDGAWLGSCQALASGGYQQENLNIVDGQFVQEYINSESADCSSPWSKVTKHYHYTLTNATKLSRTGAFLALELTAVTLHPYEALVVDALKQSCAKPDIILNSDNDMQGIQCQGNVQYPAIGANHYELIKKDQKITLGEKLDVVNAANRSTQLSTKRVFTLSVG